MCVVVHLRGRSREREVCVGRKCSLQEGLHRRGGLRPSLELLERQRSFLEAKDEGVKREGGKEGGLFFFKCWQTQLLVTIATPTPRA